MKHKNPCKRIINGEPPAKVLLDTAKAGPKSLQYVDLELDGNEKTRLGIITSETLRVSAVESIILQGFLLDLYQIATNEEKQLFASMLEDVEISRTQAYRSIAVWRKLGQRLVSSPEVMRRFVPEAMKLVCEAKMPEAARDEVFELAVKGRRINTKLVHEIGSKHGVSSEATKPVSRAQAKPSKVEKPKSESRKQSAIFSFVGDFVRLVVKTKGGAVDTASPSVMADVIRDTEKCLEVLRRRYAAMKNKSKLTKAG